MPFVNDFVAYTSRWRTSLIIAGAIGFVVMGMWMAGLLGPVPILRDGLLVTEFWGWFSILFFGSCAVAGAKRWLKNSEQLRIGPMGIKWSRWSDQMIPWNEISDVTEWRYKGQNFVVLHLYNPSNFPGRAGSVLAMRANKFLTGGDIGITLTGTDREFADAMRAINEFRTRN